MRCFCRPYVADVYEAILKEVEAYAMDTSLLIGRRRFRIDEQGHVKIRPAGVAKACERRRTKVRSLVARLVDPQQVPVFDEAFRFETAETFAERKNLIHHKTAKLKQSKVLNDILDEDAQKRWPSSDWTFDRILYYVHRESHADHLEDLALDQELERAQIELEKVRSRGKGASLMALHYSLGPLEKVLQKVSENGPDLCHGKEARDGVVSLLDHIRKHRKRFRADRGGQLRETLARIEAVLGPAESLPSQ